MFRNLSRLFFCSENNLDPVLDIKPSRIFSPRRKSSTQYSFTQYSSPLAPPDYYSPSKSPRKSSFLWDPEALAESVGDITIRPTSKPASQRRHSVDDDSATESENESAVANFIAEIKRKKRLSSPHSHLLPVMEPAVQGSISENENSLLSEPAMHSSPTRADYISSQASMEDDTQALYMAGAPPSDFTFPTMDSDESIPSFVKDFVNISDDDDGSYPAHIPRELRN